MAILEILQHPDQRLRKKARAVSKFDASIKSLVHDMFDTMYDAPGIWLAATQINIHKRVIVVDVSRDCSDPMHFVNPVILSSEGKEETQEGCLSVPGIQEIVERAENIRVEFKDYEGNTMSLEAAGLLAVCIQHEIDHLNGKLFVDYLSLLKQNVIRRRLEKTRRQTMTIGE